MQASVPNTLAALVLAAGLVGPIARASVSTTETRTRYDLQTDRGRLYVLVRFERGVLASALGHDHVVVAQAWSGTVDWHPGVGGGCSIDVRVPTAGLTVDPGRARSWEGLDGSTSDRDKAAIGENLRSERQLDAKQHPAIRFVADRCAPDGTVSGHLSIRGATVPVTIPMQIETDATTIHARGRFSLDHADLGFAPFKALGGALRNQERLEFVIDVHGAA